MFATPESPRPPLPPFTREDSNANMRAAEDPWNSRDPTGVSLACTADCRLRTSQAVSEYGLRYRSGRARGGGGHKLLLFAGGVMNLCWTTPLALLV